MYVYVYMIGVSMLNAQMIRYDTIGEASFKGNPPMNRQLLQGLHKIYVKFAS